ncbi:serine/threonine-protein kinase [Streptomyces sp. PSKA30]|uniref:serine/threonine-protein kinase n=1 Tax=Streptomyces sp. PSKA30 TaxID=2874597 RepID=UPI0027E076D7|nr:serine/threonine-protein kinase [Streptomyces sp. PSKA30]
MSLRKDDPTEVGGYKLERRLGAGGMGVVYLARSPQGRTVALKVVRREWAQDEEFRARFELEVAAARMVHSRYTAPVVDASPRGPEPWMATLYIPGRSLDRKVSKDGPLSGPELSQLARGLAQALVDIHRAGVIHRDLKPSNVLLTEDGPRVIDFGVARATDGAGLTETGHIVGTPAFMAPEQLQSSRTVGPEADVFALGCILSFAATGNGPFRAHGAFGVAYQVVHEEPDLTGVPDGIRELVADCLMKEPANRPTPAAILSRLAAPAAAPAQRGLSTRRTWAVLKQVLTRRVPAWAAAASLLAAVPLTLGPVRRIMDGATPHL